MKFFYDTYSSYQVNKYRYSIDETDEYPTLAEASITHQGSSLIGIRNKTVLNITQNLQTEFFYKFQTSVDEKNELWDEFVNFPNHTLSLKYSYRVAEKFQPVDKREISIRS